MVADVTPAKAGVQETFLWIPALGNIFRGQLSPNAVFGGAFAGMTKSNHFLIVAAVFFLKSAACALASQTGADFLRIGAGARATGMGSAFTAVADDATAIYWNPAGLSMMFKPEVNFMHSQWLLGTNYDFLGYAQPTRLGSFGLGITRLSDGQIEGRAADRSQTGGFTAADTAYALGYSRMLGASSRLGASVKYISSRIGSDSASTFALDLGVMKSIDSLPIGFGVAVQNIGPGLKYISQRDPLPLSVTGGAALAVAGAMRLALDVKYEPNVHQTSVGVGTEYALFSVVALRAGYSRALGAQSPSGGTTLNLGGSALTGFGGGVGLRLDRYSADYTITPFGDLGNVQQLSVGVRFGASTKRLKSASQNSESPSKEHASFIW